jgi:hypothetical protein
LSTATRPSVARAVGLWAVPIVLVLVLLVALGVTLAHSEPRLTGTNSVPIRLQYIGLQPRQQVCQGSQLLPQGAGRMRMFISPVNAGDTPQASMRILQQVDGLVGHSRGRYVRPGAEPAVPGTEGHPLGRMDFPIDPPVRHTRTDAYVCVRNTGHTTLVIMGVLTKLGNVRLGQRQLDIALTTLWFAPKQETWLQDLGAIVPRVGHARMGGIWTFWVAGLLLLATLALALVIAIRENTA